MVLFYIFCFCFIFVFLFFQFPLCHHTPPMTRGSYGWLLVNSFHKPYMLSAIYGRIYVKSRFRREREFIYRQGWFSWSSYWLSLRESVRILSFCGLHSFRTRENTNQKNSEYRHFSSSVWRIIKWAIAKKRLLTKKKYCLGNIKR